MLSARSAIALFFAACVIGVSVLSGAIVLGSFSAGIGIYPPPHDAFRRIIPPRPTWMAWWEANRDPYLDALRLAHPPKPDPQAFDKQRKAARAALLEALEASSPQLRAFAAIALGQMGDEAFLVPLQKAIEDSDVRVSQAAILAIGLLQTPNAETFLAHLVAASKKNRARQQSALLAQALINPLAANRLANIERLASVDPVASPVASWALTRTLDPLDPAAPRYFSDSVITQAALGDGSRLALAALAATALAGRSANPTLFQAVLSKTNVPWIADQAMFCLARQDKLVARPALCEIVAATPKAQAMPVFQLLHDQDDRLNALWTLRKSKVVREDIRQWNFGHPAGVGQSAYLTQFFKAIGGRTAADMAVSQVNLAYWQLHNTGDTYDAMRYSNATILDFQWLALALTDESFVPLVYHINIGVEPLFESDLRASAAFALADIGDPASSVALLKAINAKDDEYSDPFKAAALIALGQLGDPASLPALANVIRPSDPRIAPSKERLRSPLRGFAAIAIGLYCRPANAPDGLVDRPGADKACLLLAQHLADPKEEPELRAACAMALALTGRPGNLDRLLAASKAVNPTEQFVAGYLLLARAMLGDRTVIEPANAVLTKNADRSDLPRLLGRRAAVLALGLTGSPQALPILSAAWPTGYDVGQEAALALTFCGNVDFTTRLLAALKDDAHPQAQALAARSLGELFARRPCNLTRLLPGSNYMLPVPRLAVYRTLAHEFLFTQLIPPDQWDTLKP